MHEKFARILMNNHLSRRDMVRHVTELGLAAPVAASLAARVVSVDAAPETIPSETILVQGTTSSMQVAGSAANRVQIFYGPWNVTVQSREAYFAQRFTISGSDASDGTYPGVPGTGPGDVTGTQWTLNFEWNDNSRVDWHPSDSSRSAEFTLSDGLVVHAGADDNFEAVRDGDYDDLVLRCVSNDPDLHPYRGIVPYDYTITQEQLDRYRKTRPDEKDPVRLPREGDKTPEKGSGEASSGPLRPVGTVVPHN